MSAALLASSAGVDPRVDSDSNAAAGSAHLNGHASDRDAPGQAPLLRALQRNLDPDSPAEVSAEVVEASLDAVGRVAATAGGAALLLTEGSGLVPDVAGIALGRAGAGAFG